MSAAKSLKITFDEKLLYDFSHTTQKNKETLVNSEGRDFCLFSAYHQNLEESHNTGGAQNIFDKRINEENITILIYLDEKILSETTPINTKIRNRINTKPSHSSNELH